MLIDILVTGNQLNSHRVSSFTRNFRFFTLSFRSYVLFVFMRVFWQIVEVYITDGWFLPFHMMMKIVYIG